MITFHLLDSLQMHATVVIHLNYCYPSGFALTSLGIKLFFKKNVQTFKEEKWSNATVICAICLFIYLSIKSLFIHLFAWYFLLATASGSHFCLFCELCLNAVVEILKIHCLDAPLESDIIIISAWHISTICWYTNIFYLLLRAQLTIFIFKI